jgi:hypothetical protein
LITKRFHNSEIPGFEGNLGSIQGNLFFVRVGVLKNLGNLESNFFSGQVVILRRIWETWEAHSFLLVLKVWM